MSESPPPERRESNGCHPSMLGGHAKYIQGAIASTFGAPSGKDLKQSAVNEMRRASNASASSSEHKLFQSNILGTVEKKLGDLTGCEGLSKEGEERMIPE